jgi:hypothetical protein
METDLVTGVVAVCTPLAIYLYHRYKKMTAKDSPGGKKVTWDELVETFNDPEFWKHAEEVKNAIEDGDNDG